MRTATTSSVIILLCLLMGCSAVPTSQPAELPSNVLKPGDYRRTVEVGGMTRSYLLHVPASLNARSATPVVLAFHGAATNADFMVNFTGLNAKADEAGFVVAYPNGTGVGDLFLTFNAGGLTNSDKKANDVEFTSRLLDDLSTVINVDAKRVYATGYSNGAMMCYRLAAELSDRIAAIAPVAGTMTSENAQPKRPVPVMHFHGTEDGFVRYGGPGSGTPRFIKFMSVEGTVQAWANFNGCTSQPQTVILPVKGDDPTKVTRRNYGPGKEGAEVVLFIIEGGGHTWPGGKTRLLFLGNTTKSISANDLMWEFFQKRPMR